MYIYKYFFSDNLEKLLVMSSEHLLRTGKFGEIGIQFLFLCGFQDISHFLGQSLIYFFLVDIVVPFFFSF